MAFEASMFDDYLNTIRNFLRKKNLTESVGRIWVFKSKCAVVDFVYKDINFAFDFTPLSDGLVSIDLVQRSPSPEFRVTSVGKNKEQLSNAMSLDNALILLETRFSKITSDIDKYSESRLSTSDVPVGNSTDISIGQQAVPAAKNVGVLTLALNENIGGNLQAYALMEALRQLGHNPVLINRRGGIASATHSNDISLMSNSIGMSKDIVNRIFIDKYITPITRKFTSSSELRENISRYNFDAIIVGSDQVWRPKYARSLLMDFFLQFLSDEVGSRIKKISYAASFGAPRWEFDESQSLLANGLIKRFDAVSVREDSAVALCRKYLKTEAEHVLDPTMLLDSSHYVSRFSLENRVSVDNKLLAYVLDRSDDKKQLIESVSKRLSLNAYNAKNQLFSEGLAANNGPEDATVEGWLASFHEAKYVVTDSFHGVVFSILFNKPFIAYGNPSRGLARFTSLLKMFGLEKRLIVKSGDSDLERILQPINWSVVNERLDKLRTKSFDFLKSALIESKPVAEQSSSIKPTVIKAAATMSAREKVHSRPLCEPLNVLCSGCGVCVSETKGELSMAWDSDGFLVPRAVSNNIPISAVKVCPFNPKPDNEVKDEDAIAKLFLPSAKNFDARAGRFESAYVGYSKKYRPTSSSGGVATYVFEQLLKRGDVEYLFVVQSDGKSGYKYQMFNKGADIQRISKTRYIPVSLDGLFSEIEKVDGRVAVSGVACFIKAIRLKQHYHPELKQRIPFLLGIICGGLKSRYYTDYLAQSAGVKGRYTNPNYRVKDSKRPANEYSFSAVDENFQVHEIKMHRLGDMWGSGLFKAKACDFCTDVLTELADISLGDAWLPEYKADGMGNSVVVTRSILAEKIIRSGIESGDLVFDEVPIAQISRSQGGGFGHKRTTVKFRVWVAKHFLNIPVPVIRPRLLTSVPVSEALIQIRRERARSKSLVYWKESKDAEIFRKRMHSTLKDLKEATSARKADNYDPLAMGHLMSRWLMRKVNSNQVNFDMLRRVIKKGVITPRTTKAASPQKR